jgi:hypothetical protein
VAATRNEDMLATDVYPRAEATGEPITLDRRIATSVGAHRPRPHHSGAHHPSHHRRHPIAHEASDLLGVRPNGLRESWIIGGFLGYHTGRGEGQLAAIPVGTSEKSGQAAAHAHDLCALIKVGVHARHVRLEVRDKIRRIRLGGGAYPAGYLLDGAGYFAVPVEHVPVEAHIRRGGTHHAAAVGQADAQDG